MYARKSIKNECTTPYPALCCRGLVEASLGKKLDSVFMKFDDRPLGAASIGQVHRATLTDGREVVVKVRLLSERHRWFWCLVFEVDW